MLAKNKKQKGKKLERWVAKELRKIFLFSYARADSGSGLHRKEDVSLPDDIPLFIECKNHAEPDFKRWWRQIETSVYGGKYPVLVYKKNYQRYPRVQMFFFDLLSLISQERVKIEEIDFIVDFSWQDFIRILKNVFGKAKML